MPVDKQVLQRYQVLNRCFRNRFREYAIDDLVDECKDLTQNWQTRCLNAHRNTSGAYQDVKYFSYYGKRLDEIRKEKESTE